MRELEIFSCPYNMHLVLRKKSKLLIQSHLTQGTGTVDWGLGAARPGVAGAGSRATIPYFPNHETF